MNTFGQNQTQSNSWGNNNAQWSLNNTALEQNNNLFNQNQSVWNKKQYQTPTPWAQQNSGIVNNNQTFSTKPVYTNPNPKRFSTGDIIWEGVKGFGQGVLGGIEHGINTLSLGLYDLASDAFFDGGYEKRQKELETLKDIQSFLLKHPFLYSTICFILFLLGQYFFIIK